MKATTKQFHSATIVANLVNAYFAGVGIEANAYPKTVAKTSGQPVPSKGATGQKRVKSILMTGKHDPPTITGLALHLGFDSLEDFERYENKGRYAVHLKRGRLLVAAAYEKKLHNTNPSGAIFALKNLGWNQEKGEDKTTSKEPSSLQIKIIETGPPLASDEKEVEIS